MDWICPNYWWGNNGGQMTHRIIFFLLSFICSTWFWGCYETEQFPDLPKNFKQRQEAFPNIAKLLDALPSAAQKEALVAAEHKDKRVRRAAALRLSVVGKHSQQATDILIKTLKNDTEYRVRTAAARALGQAAPKDGAQALVNAICDPHPDVRLYAWKSILQMDTVAFDAVAPNLGKTDLSSQQCPTKKNPKYTLRHELTERVKQREGKALQLLTYALTQKDEQVLRTSLHLIKKIGRLAASAIPNIVELIQHQDETIRLAAVDALTSIGDQHPLVMPSLYRAQTDEAARVQTAAQNAVRKIRAQQTQAASKTAPNTNRARQNRHGRRSGSKK